MGQVEGEHNKPLMRLRLKEEPWLSRRLKGQTAQTHNHRCHLTPGCKVTARGRVWFRDVTCVPINHLPHLVRVNLVSSRARCQCGRVSLDVINYITTNVRAGAEWNWRSELRRRRVMYLPVHLHLSARFSPWLSLNHMCVWVCARTLTGSCLRWEALSCLERSKPLRGWAVVWAPIRHPSAAFCWE